MIVCHECLYFDKKERICLRLNVNVMKAMERKNVPFRVPSGIKDLSCTGFRFKEVKRQLTYSLSGELLKFNYKK